MSMSQTDILFRVDVLVSSKPFAIIGAVFLRLGDRIDQTMPQHFTLEQNYPNPFTQNTQVRYKIAQFHSS